MTFEDTVVALGRYVCPVFKRDGMGRPAFVGTGTLAVIGGHHFLITASHVLDKLEGGPVTLAGGDRLLDFARKSVQYDHNPLNKNSIDADVGVVYIPPEKAASISLRFKFTSISKWGDISPYDKLTVYALLGYPGNKCKVPYKRPTEMVFDSFFFVLREFVEVAAVDSHGKNDSAHFALRANQKKFTNLKFERRNIPDPHGVSGGGVWRISLKPNTGEPIEPILVGIGIETLKQPDCFLFTRIGMSFKLISNLFSELDLAFNNE